jgi:DNA-binding FrmR family transcriptional regulator
MVGYSDDKAASQTRIRRTEGQIRGLQRMVEDDAHGFDVLTQISAARALAALTLELLDSHLAHWVHDAILVGDENSDAKVREANGAIQRLVRS